MSIESNKSIVRHMWQAAYERNSAVLDELVAPQHLLHSYPEDRAFGDGREGFKSLVTTWLVFFPASQMTIEDLVAEGDRVALRYTLKPTPSTVTTGFWMHRLLEGKIVESWVVGDRLGLVQQLKSL